MNRLSIENLAVPVAASVLGAGLLAGCGGAQIEDEQVLNYNPEPTACSPEAFTIDTYEQNAADCADYLNAGSIALVGYGIADGELKKIALNTQKTLRQNIKDSKISVKAITASPAANAVFQDINEKCVNLDTHHTTNRSDHDSTTKLQRLGSFIADAKMPELHAFDQVVGISNKENCNYNEIGTSSYRNTGRYAEIFTGTIGEDNEYSKPRANRIADFAIHELGHNVNLGHGKAVIDLEKEAPLAYQSIVNNGGELNLNQIGQVEEYADMDSYMGGYDDTAEPQDTRNFNAIQKEHLNRLARTSLPTLLQPISNKAQYLDYKDSGGDNSGQAIVVTLEQPIDETQFQPEYSGEDGDYDSLAIETTKIKGDDEQYDGVKIFAYDVAENQTVELARVRSNDDDQRYCIKLGGTSVRIVVSPTSVAVKQGC